MITVRKGRPGFALLIAVLMTFLAACSGSDKVPTSPGNPEVYKRIAAETNCILLQKEFDQAMANADAREPGNEQRKWSIAYADYTNKRMEKVGCYK